MNEADIPISQLQGLGEKSAGMLAGIGVTSLADLRKKGAVAVFAELRCQHQAKLSMNLLYAMVGALREEHWATVAKTEKSQLLAELGGYEKLMQLMEEPHDSPSSSE